MDDVVARGGRCETDADCAYYPMRSTSTAGVTDKASAADLERVGRLYTEARCDPPLGTSATTSRHQTIHITCEDKHCMGATFF